MTHSPAGPASRPDRPSLPALPDTPAARLIEPLTRFLQLQSASGIVLIVCTVVALVLANSPWAEAWDHFWHTEARVSLGAWDLHATLAHLVNDGLMTVFFFLVGLEIKRELADGELRSPQKAALPIFAAVGGMLVPASFYLLHQAGREGVRGWGIPMATDIAFAVGILALLGRRVPLGLKIFLLALAIADDIGAILVIALFYSGQIAWTPLGLATLGVAIVQVLNRIGVRSVTVYVLVGIGIWLGMFHSGIHPTVAGVLLGMMTPVRPWIAGETLSQMLLDAVDRLGGTSEHSTHGHGHSQIFGKLAVAVRESASPLVRLEAALHPWVAFVIMPIFALANAGVPLNPAAAGHGVAWSVATGLVLGKPLGIVLFSWLAVRLGIARLPAGISWSALAGAGCLGGIGFTMSLFIAGLALKGTLLEAAKIGTLAGSTLSAVAGLALLVTFLPQGENSAEATQGHKD